MPLLLALRRVIRAAYGSAAGMAVLWLVVRGFFTDLRAGQVPAALHIVAVTVLTLLLLGKLVARLRWREAPRWRHLAEADSGGEVALSPPGGDLFVDGTDPTPTPAGGRRFGPSALADFEFGLL